MIFVSFQWSVFFHGRKFGLPWILPTPLDVTPFGRCDFWEDPGLI